MTTAIPNRLSPGPSRAEIDQAGVDLEYHSLMGVLGGDEPTHVRSFERSVFARILHPARATGGAMTAEHSPRL